MLIPRSIILLGLLTFSGPSYSLQIFLNAWRDIYPDSNADDIAGTGCQVCHLNDNGNEPWNEYGWTIRQIYNANQFDIVDAINTAADFDVDNDPLGISSEDEINRSFQPGWTEGEINTVFSANGVETNGVLPPAVPTTTGIDFPAEVSNPIPDVVSGAITIELHEVSGDFNAPLQAVTAPGITGSIFVVEQTGKIFRVNLSTGSKSLFHDVSTSLVEFGGGNDERGLLGLTFHPNFANNGLFYTYQSEEEGSTADFSTSNNVDHQTKIVQYRASDPSCNSSIVKQKTLLVINQPQGNHNGGDLAFGPDGYLYISLGDGGGAHDRGQGHGVLGNGRDNTNVLGTILRIDPLGNNSANGNYGIPNDNPFAANDLGVDEVYAYGLRNPFRFSFDVGDSFGNGLGDLYVGDVGQGEVEEVNLVSNGDNLGWNWKEGSLFFYHSVVTSAYISDVAPPALPNDLVDPIAEYSHDDGVSITGGYVYRGTQVPELQGRYVFADFVRRLFYLDTNFNVREFLGSGVSDFVTGFGQDSQNELYALTRVISSTTGTQGKLQKIMASGATYSAPDAGEESAQCPPNDEICVPIKATNGNIALICL